MNQKLSFKTKLSYGVGGICDNTLYTLSSTYLLLFLTTVAGVNPAIAGTISAVGSVWEAILGPLIGFKSDDTFTRFGRRKPFMMFAAIPVAVVTGLLFTAIDASPAFKAVYYCLMIVLFWTFFSMEFIPYLSWGADLTEDYNERTVLRSFAYVFNQVGMLIGMVLPTIIVDWAMNRGQSEASSWQTVGVFCGVCAGLALLLCTMTIKKDDKDPGSPEFIQKKAELKEVKRQNHRSAVKTITGMFKEYAGIIRLKPMMLLLGSSMAYLIANTIFSSDRVFYMTYNLGMSQKAVSAMMLLITVSGVAFVPFIVKFANKMDKKTVFGWGIGVSGVIMIAMRFVNMTNSMTYCVVTCLVYSLANTCYWQLMPSMVYDMCEVDELESGKSHSGAVISLQALSESVCIAIGLQALGIILDLSGFDESLAVGMQPESALTWVSNSYTLIPGIFMLITFFAIRMYPITREKFAEIQAQLAERRPRNTQS